VATPPAPRTWVTGEVVTASEMNTNISDVLTFLLAPPIFKGYQTVAQTLTSGTFTAVLLDSEVVDSSGMHSTVSNTSRATAVYPGWYDKGGGCTFAANATGRRLNRVVINNATVVPASLSGIPANAAAIGWAYRSDFAYLNVGEYVEDQIFQDSGGNLATFVTNTEYDPSMTLRWCSN
jgi:hypothetical protein